MASTRDSINFCVASVGRNRFLQRATGLFGGDEWALGTYTAVDDHYRRSQEYSRTMTLWRDRTNSPLYQREPTACWYAMGTATVTALSSSGVLTLAWVVSDALWNTVRVPGQTFSCIVQGLPVHGTLMASTSQSSAAVALPQGVAASALPTAQARPWV